MLYIYFLAINFFEMLVETWISIRNSTALLKRGAIEIGPALLPVMAALYIFLYLGCLLEYLYVPRTVSPVWAGTFLLLYLLAKALKFWAIRSLGSFWTMRVLIVPDSAVVNKGPYRWIRHPNYVAVLTEIGATALVGKCFYTGLIVLTLFSITLVFRIRLEEKGLRDHTDYAGQMESRSRFLP